MSLRAETSLRGQTAVVWMDGDVNGELRTADLFTFPRGSDVILYLADVRRINSFGVREWIKAMAELSRMARHIIWVDCSYSMAQQLNMIAGFTGESRVCSIRAPFSCPKCNEQSMETIELLDPQLKLPKITCAKCQTTMELDEDPDAFFSFKASGAAIERQHRDLYSQYKTWNQPGKAEPTPVKDEDLEVLEVMSTPEVRPVPAPAPAPAPAAITAKVAAPRVTQPAPAPVNTAPHLAARRGVELSREDANAKVLKMLYFAYGLATGAILGAVTTAVVVALTRH